MKTRHEKIIIGAGLWLILLSFMGFPEEWKAILTTLTGVVVVYVGAILLKKARLHCESPVKEIKTETFTETNNQH